MYLADGNAVDACRLYQEWYPERRCPYRKKHIYISVLAFEIIGILHLVLPTGDDQDVRLLKESRRIWKL
jgi:hypothetical protein